MKRAGLVLLLGVILVGGVISGLRSSGRDVPLVWHSPPSRIVEREGHPAEGRLDKSDADWERELTPEQFRITRRSGTELACSGPYLDTKEEGVFHCVCCGQALFDSSRKYDSGTGWPSYWEPVDAEHVTIRADDGIFGRRFEVLCSRCNAHLGHVFEDGPQPTGLRYCMNGQALRFVPRQTTAKKEDK